MNPKLDLLNQKTCASFPFFKELHPKKKVIKKTEFSHKGKAYNSELKAQDEVIKIFLNCLRDQYPNTTIKRPALGSSGCTFLCSFSSAFLTEEAASFFKVKYLCKEIKPISFVIKLLGIDQAFNEKSSSDFLRHFNLNVPSIALIEECKIKAELMTVMQKNHTTFPPGPISDLVKEKEIIIMPKFSATTLDSLIKEKRILDLSDQDMETLATAIGETAIFDLLIGNNDRFVRFNPLHPTELDQPLINSGNLMVELDQSWKSEKTKIKNIYLIDNAVTSSLIPRPKITEEMQSLTDLFTFSEDLSSHYEKEEYASREKEKIEVKHTPYVEKLKETLPHYLNNLTLVKEHIVQGFKIELESVKNDEQEENNHMERFLKILEANLEIGFKSGISKAKMQAQNSKILSVFSYHTSEFSTNFQELITHNFSYLSKF